MRFKNRFFVVAGFCHELTSSEAMAGSVCIWEVTIDHQTSKTQSKPTAGARLLCRAFQPNGVTALHTFGQPSHDIGLGDKRQTASLSPGTWMLIVGDQLGEIRLVDIERCLHASLEYTRQNHDQHLLLVKPSLPLTKCLRSSMVEFGLFAGARLFPLLFYFVLFLCIKFGAWSGCAPLVILDVSEKMSEMIGIENY